MSVRVIQGDCRTVLATLPDESVQCVVTSPPYFGLRDYGVDGQIGLELTPDAYVAEMVAVFREVRRVLRDDGTLWLNLGDSYAGSRWAAFGEMADRSIASQREMRRVDGSHRARSGAKPKDLLMIPARVALALQADGWWLRSDIIWHKPNPMPESITDRPTSAHEHVFLLTKNERYFYDADAIAEPSCASSLDRQAQDVDAQTGSSRANGGAKTNGSMKAVSGSRRPQTRRALELAALHGLTDAHLDALRACGVGDVGKAQITQSGFGKNTEEVMRLATEAKAALGGYTREFLIADKRNARNVWTIATQPYSGAHFATMPPLVAETCIKAGTSSRGGCPVCGAGWVRQTVRVDQGYDGSKYGERAVAATGGVAGGGTARSTLGSSNGSLTGHYVTAGWKPSCSCRSECSACEGGGLGGTQYSPATPGGVVEQCCEACDGKGIVFPQPAPQVVGTASMPAIRFCGGCHDPPRPPRRARAGRGCWRDP